MSGLTVQVRGTKETRKLLKDLSGRELQNRTRRATRSGAAVFREAVRAEAKSRSDIPDSFARTKTRGHRSPVGTSTGPTSPLLNIFEEGADPHGVGKGAPNSKGTKDFLSGEGFFARAPVHHPGMDARPLIGPVFDDKHDEASDKAMDELLRGLR